MSLYSLYTSSGVYINNKNSNNNILATVYEPVSISIEHNFFLAGACADDLDDL